VKALKLSSY